jgi:hypoxanthine phosphoribosyltransferase
MVHSQEKIYYKAVRQAVNAAASAAPLKEKLDTIIQAAARCLDAAASVLVLDPTSAHLIYAASTKLPPYYVRKGVLDARRSLGETCSQELIFIENAGGDSRLQHPELAARAGIVSILGAPAISQGRVLGTLRIYFKSTRMLAKQDEVFVRSMAGLVAVVLGCEPSRRPEASSTQGAGSAPRYREAVIFAHPSEEEFAGLLSFYGIDWIYEPRSFPLEKRNEPASEMFTPDFYLPALDLYVELTTMKQSLVTHKNRKLRRLKELFPEVKISLLYKNDYDRLLAKYGVGPLAQSRAHGIRRVLYTASDIDRRVRQLAAEISADYGGRRPLLVGVQRGFLCFMADLMRQVTVPLDLDFMTISYYRGGKGAGVQVTRDLDAAVEGRHIILIEDIVDTGITLNYILAYLRAKNPASLKVCTLLDRRARRLAEVELDYVGFVLPDEFIVGYGLDYREEYRNLPFIAIPEICDLPPDAEGE